MDCSLGVYVNYSAGYLFYLRMKVRNNIFARRHIEEHTMTSLLMLGFFSMKSTMLPLVNQGIATASVRWFDDVSNQVGHMFGWLSVDHLCSASARVCIMDESTMWIRGDMHTEEILFLIFSSFRSNLIHLIAIVWYRCASPCRSRLGTTASTGIVMPAAVLP